MNNFSHKKIKSVVIEKEYTAKSKILTVTLDEAGDVDVSIKFLNALRKISKLEKINTVRETYFNFANTLNIKSEDEVSWGLIAGKNYVRSYLIDLRRQIEDSKKLVTSYYTDGVYQKRSEVYKRLEPVLLDGQVLDKPKYSHCSTTGRTSIVEGYNFLTMSKEKRRKLTHKDPNVVLVEIDFKSCEPNFYLKALGREVDGLDVYEDIARKINMEINDRARFKRGILSVMYGARDSTSKNILRCNFKDLEKIKKYFEIEKFKSSLVEGFEKDNVIYNYYGRPICYDSSLVNYWIQSSAVDYCSLAFSKLIKDMSLKPCFFVHDSVTIAVDKKRIEEIKSIEKVLDEYSGIEIPVEVSIVSK